MGQVYTWVGGTLLPMPEVVRVADICSIGIGFPNEDSENQFIASDIDGQLYIWADTTLLPYPSELNDVKICQVSGDPLGYIALDQEGKVYTWQQETMLPVPAVLEGKKICEVGGIPSVATPFFARDDQGEVYTWFDEGNLLPVPPNVQAADICFVDSGITNFAATDVQGNLYLWLSSPDEIIILNAPSDLDNNFICKAYALYLILNPNNPFGFSAIDQNGLLYMWQNSFETGEVINILDYPNELKDKVCAFGGLMAFIATGAQNNIITWILNEQNSVETLPHPSVLDSLKICEVAGGYQATEEGNFIFIAITCPSITCPSDITIMSDIPIIVDLPDIGDCYNYKLGNGLVIDTEYEFPLGLTTVTLNYNCSGNCSNNCTGCAGCPNCASCPLECSFLVNIIPQNIIPIQPDTSLNFINTEPIDATQIYDFAILDSNHIITLNTED